MTIINSYVSPIRSLRELLNIKRLRETVALKAPISTRQVVISYRVLYLGWIVDDGSISALPECLMKSASLVRSRNWHCN